MVIDHKKRFKKLAAEIDLNTLNCFLLKNRQSTPEVWFKVDRFSLSLFFILFLFVSAANTQHMDRFRSADSEAPSQAHNSRKAAAGGPQCPGNDSYSPEKVGGVLLFSLGVAYRQHIFQTFCFCYWSGPQLFIFQIHSTKQPVGTFN